MEIEHRATASGERTELFFGLLRNPNGRRPSHRGMQDDAPANRNATALLAVARPPGIPVTATLLERNRALGELMECWSSACEGGGCVALLGGEAGIGRTSVVRQLVRRVSGRTLLGACAPLSVSHMPGPLEDLAVQLGRPVAKHLASLERGGDILAELVGELATDPGPTLVVLDDVQWADPSSLDLIRYLARRCGRLRLMLVVSFRDDEVCHPLRVVLGELSSCDAVRRIQLDPLSLDAVSTLAVGGALDARDLHRRTGGNPFLVIEALAAPDALVPSAVRDAVVARIARTTCGERAALEATAVLGAQSHSDRIDRLVGGRDGLASSLARRILRVDGERVEFRQELVRDAVLSTLTGERRRTWHLRALAMLATDSLVRHQAPDVLAHHADGAGDSATAYEYGVAAARAASRQGAHAQAAEHYARAHRHVSRADLCEHAVLLEAHAHECYLLADLARATELRSQAAETRHRLGDHRRHGDNLRWLSVLCWFAGRAAESRRNAVRAVEVLATAGEGRELAAAYGNQSWLYMCAAEPTMAMKWGRKAIALSHRLGDTATESEARSTVGAARAQVGDPSAMRDLGRSVDLAREGQPGDHLARVLAVRSAVFVTARDIPRAMAALVEGLEFTQAQNLDIWHLHLRGYHALALLHAGNLTEAVEAAIQLLAHPAITSVGRIQPLTVIGRVRARQGASDAWLPLDDALALAEQTGELQQIVPARIARAELAWLTADVDRARSEVHAVLPLARGARTPWLAGELMFLLALTGERTTPPQWIAHPYASYLRQQFAAAAGAWSSLGCPFERALSLAGDDSEAGLRGAFELLERLGMTAVADRAAERLRKLGVRRIPRGRRATTRANVAGLTDRELEVLALISHGSKNAEIGRLLFISPKTVDHHVSAILAKIEVDDRVAAARWYRAHGNARCQRGGPSPQCRDP